MAPLAFEVAYRTVKVALLMALKVPLGLLAGLVFVTIPGLFTFASLHTLDLAFFLVNVLTPPLRKGSIVKPGKPGHAGIWPTFVAPTETDSRSPCPYLNALANHGILPHDGKNIDLDTLGRVMNESFNFSTTLCKDTTNAVAGLYGRNYIQLSDLGYHNIIEHDASLIRHDHYFEPDHSAPAKDLIHKMLASATGRPSKEYPGGRLTANDLSRFLVVREKHSKKENPLFSLSLAHRFFGASNASLMLEVANGDVDALRTILTEERFPDGWETQLRQRCGYSMVEFHSRSAEIHFGRSDVPFGN